MASHSISITMHSKLTPSKVATESLSFIILHEDKSSAFFSHILPPRCRPLTSAWLPPLTRVLPKVSKGREGGRERGRERGERGRERERDRERETPSALPSGCGGIVKQSGLPFSLAPEMPGDRGEAAGGWVRMGSHRVSAPSWPCQAMTPCHCPLHPSPVVTTTYPLVPPDRHRGGGSGGA